MNEPEIDAAIDRTVSRMMSVDADPALRARVLASLARPAPRIFTWTRTALAGSAVALVVVLALVLLRAPRHEASLETAAVRQTPASPVAAAAEPEAVVPRVDRRSPVRRAPRARRVAAAAAPDADMEPALPPIPPLESVEMRPMRSVEPGDIDPRVVTIAPLADMPDVQIEPLSFPPAGRS